MVHKLLNKEVASGRMAGPFAEKPFDKLICSPIGLVDKKGTSDKRMIMHLSHPKGKSVNSFIDPAVTKTQYQPFDLAVQLVVQHGRFCFMSKADGKSAFRIIPIRFQDLMLLGIYFDNNYYVDLCLPFGSSISCALFECFATMFNWILNVKTLKIFMHYLDDFFTVDADKKVCIWSMVCLADQVGFPLCPQKFVPPTQCLEFLGLTLDSILMQIRIPRDKVLNIILMIKTTLLRRTVKARFLASLAGKLNFVCKAVPPGHPFLRRIFDTFAGRPMDFFVTLTKELKKDLAMWKYFLTDFKGLSPILLSRPSVRLFTDASGNPDLGWGAWLEDEWCFAQWCAAWNFLFEPSIDFLEFFAVLAAIWTWKQKLTNTRLFLFCDNQPVVAILSSFTSNSSDIMLLLRYLVLILSHHNIIIQPIYLSSATNNRADALSRLQVDCFFALHRNARSKPQELSGFLNPLCHSTLNNLQL